MLLLTICHLGNADNKQSFSQAIINSLPNYDYQAITPDTWKEIDFIYYDDFPYRSSYSNKLIPDCKKYINSQQKFVLRCTERINLLRPKMLVQRWQRLQKLYGWVPVNIKEIGINNVHGYITGIKATTLNTTIENLTKSQSSPVISTIERHTLTIRTYTFKNIKTGVISIINVTPEHRFYVTNIQAFEPIQMIDSDDRLINAAGNEVKLLCNGSRINHCGVKFNRSKVPVAVYNLEIYRKHRYFVGKDQILVHNICTKYVKKLDHDPFVGLWKTYEGSVNIENGQRHGFGTSYYLDGNKDYEGEWVNDKRHGQGIIYGADHGFKTYEGEWKNDLMHGSGITYVMGTGLKRREGKWEEGKFIGPGTIYNIYSGIREYEGTLFLGRYYCGIQYDKTGIPWEFTGNENGKGSFKLPPSNMVDRLFRRNISLSGQW